MVEHTPFSGKFEIVNDTGLVCERFSDGSVSFDIFDAASQPGNDADNLKYAAGIVRAVNNRDQLVGALKEATDALEHLAEHYPDCLGWAGHEEQGGPWPVVGELAVRTRQALAALGEDTKAQELDQ